MEPWSDHSLRGECVNWFSDEDWGSEYEKLIAAGRLYLFNCSNNTCGEGVEMLMYLLLRLVIAFAGQGRHSRVCHHCHLTPHATFIVG